MGVVETSYDLDIFTGQSVEKCLSLACTYDIKKTLMDDNSSLNFSGYIRLTNVKSIRSQPPPLHWVLVP